MKWQVLKPLDNNVITNKPNVPKTVQFEFDYVEAMEIVKALERLTDSGVLSLANKVMVCMMALKIKQVFEGKSKSGSLDFETGLEGLIWQR